MQTGLDNFEILYLTDRFEQYDLIMAAICNRAGHYIFALWFLMVDLWNREDHYIFILFLSSFFFFFPRLISAVGDWMFTILRHMGWP